MFLFALAPPQCVHEINMLECAAQNSHGSICSSKRYKFETLIYKPIITHSLKTFHRHKDNVIVSTDQVP